MERCEWRTSSRPTVDPRFGLSLRVFRATVAGLLWAVACLITGALHRGGTTVTHDGFMWVGVGFLALSTMATLVQRETMLANERNRRVALTSILVFALGTTLWPVLGRMHVSLEHTTAVSTLCLGALWLTVTFHSGRSWLPLPIAHFLAAPAILIWPVYHFELMGLGMGLAMIPTAILLVRDAKRAESAQPKARFESGSTTP